MFFISFIYNGKEEFGVLTSDNKSVILVNDVLNSDYKDINEFIENYKGEYKEYILDYKNKDIIGINEIKLLSPILYPKRDIICLGKNYKDHIKEVDSLEEKISDVPEYPIYFGKRATEAIGDMEYVDLNDLYSTQLDYEVELAIIIGKKGKNIDKKDAKDYIFGYTILNDFSYRDIQKKHKQWYKGKSLDKSCAIGPVIADSSDIDFPPKLDIKSFVNGELRQDSNTEIMIFDIPTIIEDVSKEFTLLPGDIISTGTPKGVGMGYNPPKFLKKGDVVRCYIENIGELTNIVR